jgi:hypothetical protein
MNEQGFQALKATFFAMLFFAVIAGIFVTYYVITKNREIKRKKALYGDPEAQQTTTATITPEQRNETSMEMGVLKTSNDKNKELANYMQHASKFVPVEGDLGVARRESLDAKERSAAWENDVKLEDVYEVGSDYGDADEPEATATHDPFHHKSEASGASFETRVNNMPGISADERSDSSDTESVNEWNDRRDEPRRVPPPPPSVESPTEVSSVYAGR